MQIALFVSVFDFLASCYVYGCLTYILILFLLQAYDYLPADSVPPNRTKKSSESDFYSQVKELLKTPTESILEPISINFNSMTIRELRAYIKENELHQQVRDRLAWITPLKMPVNTSLSKP